MTTTQIDTGLVPAPAMRFVPQLGVNTRYVLSGFPLALASTVVCVTAFATGLGLSVVWLGVPLLIFALGTSRGFAESERARIAKVLGEPVAQPHYRTTDSPNVLTRLVTVLGDPRCWRDLAHAGLRWIPNSISFSLTTTWWAGMIGGVTWGLWGWALPSDDREVPELLGFGDAYSTIVIFYLVVAVFFAATLPTVAHASARLEARFARKLLG
ncbi:sensor domain-containing protein [Actinoplanes sp. NPDC020271]|uniref:sensor domain-containing protein n=1 Tax=Actinoplanes sp. NPDC020271 TaxID=3363896 RepID=UPI0037A0EA0F